MGADLGFDVVELAPCPGEAISVRLRETAFRADAWTSFEIDVLHDMFANDAGFDEIAAAIGRGRAGVVDKAYQLGLRRNSSRPWGEIEDATLREHYGTIATAAIAQQFGRSCAAVYARAGILGLTEGNPPPYEPWEDAQIRAGYEQGVPVQQIAVLIGRAFSGIIARARFLELRHPRKPADWSDAEADRALTLAAEGHLYLAIIEMLAAEGFPRRSKNGFGQHIRILGYGRGWGRRWLPEEDELLRQAYATGASLTPIRERLGRTPCSIRWRVSELGLQGTHEKKAGWRGEIWSTEDVALLRAEFGKTNSAELAKKLGRSKAAMFCRANLLGLKHGYIRPFSDEEMRALQIAYENGVAIADFAVATGRKAFSVSKWATNHGYSFGRRRRSTWHMTLERILALETKVPVASLSDAVGAAL
ncbi:hypothetical protein BH10PSE14_BH10PSE14_04740 [soil metagenome]